MPRHPRIHAANLLYHIIARGNNRQEIFLEKKDYKKFLEFLQKKKERYPFKLYGYVLMPNHFHLLMEVKEEPTSRIMQSILTSYTKYFNYVHKRKGHLFQGRYKAIMCDRELYFLELVRYIHLNPVRSKLVETPKEWKWSGHLEYTGEIRRNLIDFELIRGVFGEGQRGYEKYIKFLEDSGGREYKKEYHPKDIEPFLGNEEFVLKMSLRKKEERKKEVNLEKILSEISKEKKINPELIKGKIRIKEISEARTEFIRRSILEYGNSQASVARYLQCDQGYISKVIRNKSS